MQPPATAGSTVFIWWASREEVPYTHRKHSILVPQWIEQQMGEQTFQQVPSTPGRLHCLPLCGAEAAAYIGASTPPLLLCMGLCW